MGDGSRAAGGGGRVVVSTGLIGGKLRNSRAAVGTSLVGGELCEMEVAEQW